MVVLVCNQFEFEVDTFRLIYRPLHQVKKWEKQRAQAIVPGLPTSSNPTSILRYAHANTFVIFAWLNGGVSIDLQY
jgi:hypothetical protein